MQYSHTPKPANVVDAFKENFRLNIVSKDDEEMIFDMVGCDTSIANALRRILLAEVPTMAIEKVWIYENSSIIQDEVLSHRLGLVPIMADPAAFEFYAEPGTDFNTALFKLEAECTGEPAAAAEEDEEGSSAAAAGKGKKGKKAAAAASANSGGGKGGTVVQPKSYGVYSGQLQWVPQGTQAQRLGASAVRPVHDDILIAKLRPGQRIVVECHAHKGIGQDHAKFSPVATASYRLLPQISFAEGASIEGADAEELVAKCPMGVFDLEDLGGGRKGVAVARPRECSMCRECVREPQWAERVRLSRKMDHFIFSVESVGAYKPEKLLSEAVNTLKEKAQKLLAALREEDEDEEDEDEEEAQEEEGAEEGAMTDS